MEGGENRLPFFSAEGTIVVSLPSPSVPFPSVQFCSLRVVESPTIVVGSTTTHATPCDIRACSESSINFGGTSIFTEMSSESKGPSLSAKIPRFGHLLATCTSRHHTPYIAAPFFIRMSRRKDFPSCLLGIGTHVKWTSFRDWAHSKFSSQSLIR